MKTITKIGLIIVLSVLLFSCSEDDKTENVSKDMEKPNITLNYTGGFPTSCSELKRGQRFTVKAKVSDNVGLASYAIDFHNNFDHHTHDDQGSKCNLSPMKDATKNTFKFFENYTIQNKLKAYEISQSILIPSNADIGDYHCQISVIDVTGWSSRTSVDVKIVE